MTQAEPGWRYLVLGSNCLKGAGKTFAPERKTAALLSYLALEGPTSRSRLAGLLWPDAAEATARNNLSQALRRSRGLTGTALVVAGDELELSALLRVDAAELKTAASEGRAADVVRYTGELLGTFDYDDLPDFLEWLWSTREVLAALTREALGALVASSEAQGNLTQAHRYAEQLLRHEPLSEIAHRHVMRLHYLLGDRPAALRAYSRCQSILKRELGVQPLPETLELARLLEQGGVQAGRPAKPGLTLPPQVLRPPVLVGREDAWALLENAWARGQTIYVTGEPGVGKTRLVQEFVESRGRGLYLPAGPGYQGVLFAGAAGLARSRLEAAPGVSLPLWVTRELGRILPEFRSHDPLPPLQNEDDKLRFYQAYCEMVRLTGAGFVAIISDDTQYYDAATVELGAFMIAQRAHQSAAESAQTELPRHIIIYRRGELALETQGRIDAFVHAELAARIELEPLSAEATITLLRSLELTSPTSGGRADSLGRLAEAVYGRTGGNALFILEVLRNLLESGGLEALPESLPLPRRVSATISQRFGRLSASAQRVVQAAAVLGSAFDIELVAKVLDTDPLALLEVWETLEQAHIFSGNRFSHDLLFETARASLSPQAATLLNRRCAEVLQNAGATPMRVAQHFLASGDEVSALPHLLKAAEHAKNAFRLVEAAARYTQAGSMFEHLGVPERAFDAFRAALELQLEFELGEPFAANLACLQRVGRTPSERATAWRLESQRQLRRGDHSAVEAASRRALAELGSGGDARSNTELLTLLAGALARQGRTADSLATLKEVFTLTGELDATTLAPQLSQVAAILDDLGRNRDAFRYHRRALELETSPRRRLAQLAEYSFSLLAFGDAEGARETLLAAQTQLGGVTDAPLTESAVLTYLGAAQHHLGCYGEALGAFVKALAISERHRHIVQSEGTRVPPCAALSDLRCTSRRGCRPKSSRER